MASKLISELIVKLTQEVSGPAAEAKKALDGVETAMAAIGKQKAAEERMLQLAKAQEAAREKVRALANDLIAAEKPTKALVAAYAQATSASDKIAKALETQRAAVAKNADGLKDLGVATTDMAAAEGNLMSEAERAAAAFVRATRDEERAARLRQSFLKETARAAAEEAAANQRLLAEQEAASRRAAEVAREAAAEQVRIAEAAARAKREAWVKEATREANEQAEINRRVIEEERKAGERRAEARREAFMSPLHTAGSMGLMVLGGGAEELMRRGAEGGAELESRKVKLAASGLSPEEVSGAYDRSADLQAKYPNMLRSELMAIEGQAYTILPDRKEVSEFVPIFAKFASAYKVAHPKAEGEEIITALEQFFKASELEGSARSAEGFAKSLDSKLKALNYQSGLIKPEDFLGFAKQAGGAATMLSEQFRNTVIPLIMAEMGGERTGTWIAALNKQLVGDFQGNNHALSEWIDMGLIRKDQVLYDKKGAAIGLKPGQHPVGYMDGVTDPLAFSETYLTPMIEAGLARRNKHMTAKERKRLLEDTEGSTDGHSLAQSHPEIASDLKMVEQLAEIRRLFPNAVAARGMQELFIQDQALRRHQQNLGNAPGLDSADNVSKDPIAAFSALTTSITNFLTTLSNPMMSTAAKYMSELSSGIAGFTAGLADFQKAHPDIAKWTAVGTTGIGVLGGGAVAWGALDGIMNGFGLKGSAAALDGAAAALTRAAVAQGGENVLRNGSGGSPIPNKGKSPLGNLWGLGTGFFALGIAEDQIDKVLPETEGGKQWGDLGFVNKLRQIQKGFKEDWDWLTKPGPAPDPRGPNVTAPSQIQPGAVDEFGRMMPTAGEKSGQDLGNGIANGLGKQSSLVVQQGSQIMALLAAELQKGVTIPLKLDTSGIQAAVDRVHAQAQGHVDAMLRSTFAHQDFT